MKPPKPFPLKASRAKYNGQKVMCALKAIRTNEIKHRMCLEIRNISDSLYNQFKVAGFLTQSEYNTLYMIFYNYVLCDRVDEAS